MMTTREDAVKALRMVIEAVEETVAECPQGAPSGVIYAALMGLGISLEHYEQIMGAMVDAGKVVRRGLLYFPPAAAAK